MTFSLTSDPPVVPKKTLYPSHRDMIRIHGEVPLGKTCGECAKLDTRKQGMKRFHKCTARGCSFSSATDHRKKWRACGLFEETQNV